MKDYYTTFKAFNIDCIALGYNAKKLLAAGEYCRVGRSISIYSYY